MTTRKAILIADDSEIDREILCELFREDFDIIEAENGFEAISKAVESDEKGVLAAVILDIAMPIISGLAVLEELREVAQRLPVILMTAESTPDNIKQGHELGMADFIVKPFRGYGVKQRVHNLIDLYEKKNNVKILEHENEVMQEEAMDFEEFSNTMIEMLGTIIEYRGIESGLHVKRIRMYTQILLECIAKNYADYNLDNDTIKTICSASAVHDIGKIAIPDNILLKPERLTPLEFEVIKSHTVKGCEILKCLDKLKNKAFLKYCYEICRHHHERWDGNGYPDRLQGDAIPISAQVVAVADVYDALTTKNVYRQGFTHEKAVNMILSGECGSFSPKMLSCLKIIEDKYKIIATNYADK
ncbi:MAG: response regulator [Oscillospiraceae bacterium]|nr:response regulator [Oscillospiraceae bacterium]